MRFERFNIFNLKKVQLLDIIIFSRTFIQKKSNYNYQNI